MALLRFLQTSDWHLGQAYRWAGPDLAEHLRAARLEAVSRVLDLAEEIGAAFVLAAGDQFDGPQPAPRIVADLLERIAAQPGIIVHMIPGNHDPCGVGTVYTLGVFQARPANLRFYDQPVPAPLTEHGATLYPCPCLTRYGRDSMNWIPPRGEGDGLRIGLAHGSLPSIPDPEGRNYPIPDDAPRRFDLDYVALGDWHKPTPDPRQEPRGRMYYAGAPAVGGWDETAAGNALEVVLEEGAAPGVTVHAVGRHEWEEVRVALHGPDDVGRLLGRLHERVGPQRLVRVKASGALQGRDRERLNEGVKQLVPDFASLELSADELRTLRDGADELPTDPLLRAVALRLERLANDLRDHPPGNLPSSVVLDAAVIEEARNRFRGMLPG